MFIHYICLYIFKYILDILIYLIIYINGRKSLHWFAQEKQTLLAKSVKLMGSRLAGGAP